MCPCNDAEATHTVHPLGRQTVSFNNVKRRKRAKPLNVYTLPNPDAPSIHQTYTFISRSQGFQAHSSRVTSSQTEPHAETEASATTIDEAFDEQIDYDICNVHDTEHMEVNSRTKRKRTAGVGLFLHLLVINPSHLSFRTTRFYYG